MDGNESKSACHSRDLCLLCIFNTVIQVHYFVNVLCELLLFLRPKQTVVCGIRVPEQIS